MPIPAPHPRTAHAERTIQDIDPERYPEWPNHYAVSVEAFRALLLKGIAANKIAADALANEIGARRLAETQRDQARGIATKNAWWAAWGFWLGVGGVLVAEAVIAGLALALSR